MNPFPQDSFPESFDPPELPDYVKEILSKEESDLIATKKKEAKRLTKALRKLVSKKEAKAITYFLLKPQEDIDDIRTKQSNYCVSVFTSLADVSQLSSDALLQMADYNKEMLQLKLRLDNLES